MPKKTEDIMALKRQIKENDLKSLYLFYGEEVYLKELYEKRIEALLPDGGFEEFNHIELEGKNVTLSEYSDALESYPMMVERKLILIKNSGIFKAPSQEVKDFWTVNLSRLAGDTVLIFDEREVDKRSATYKAAVKYGFVLEFTYLGEADLVTWVLRECLESHKKITKENAYYFISLCDGGLSYVRNELDKLISFCDKEILKTDIERVVSKSVQVQVFALTDAIMNRDANQAMRVLLELKGVKEPAFKILYLLFSTFDKMLRSKLMLAQGAGNGEIAQKIGVGPYIVKKYLAGAKGFSEDSLVRMITRVSEIDLAIKEGRAEEWTLLEQYVAECINAQK